MTPNGLTWFDRLIWALIYGGLLLVALGIATHGGHFVAGWSMGVVGGLATLAGSILVWVRSRMPDGAVEGAQSTPKAPEQK